jgi:hypothetical protein
MTLPTGELPRSSGSGGAIVWVAPLVAPAVDLSILGLLLGIRQLALAGRHPRNCGRLDGF